MSEVQPETVKNPTLLTVVNVETYQACIEEFKEILKSLNQSGYLSNETAAKLGPEYEYAFFQQLIQISLNKQA